MLFGILFLIKAIAPLENAVTTTTAADMTSDLSSLVVTARAEQIPKICNAIGLLLKSGSSRICLNDFFAIDTTPIKRRWGSRTWEPCFV